MVNKRALVSAVIAQLVAEVELLSKAARAAHAEATHEQSKAEDKYDTPGLEASYLARGQSRQAAEIEQSIAQFESLPLREFEPKDPIDLSAVVELHSKREKCCYFIGPRAGGTEVTLAGKEFVVITPHSPLGQQLMGRKKGDRLRFGGSGADDEYRIVSVL